MEAKEADNLGNEMRRFIKRSNLTNRYELDLDAVLKEEPTFFDKFVEQPVFVTGIISDKNRDLLEGNALCPVNVPSFLTCKVSDLRSKHIQTLVVLSGILKKVGLVTSKVESARFECPTCGSILHRKQDGIRIKEPARCSCGRKSHFAILSEELINIQEMELEENMEDIGSKQPGKIRLLLKNDLTDPDFSRFQVGNKVDVVGVLNKTPSYISGKEGDRTVLEYLIDVIDIIPKEGSEDNLVLSEEEVEKIKEIAKNNPLLTMANNIAPTISGLDHIKKALTLFLAKGVTKVVANGERRRGNIHLLVVGDAGLAKSALIQNIQKRGFNCRIADGKDATKAGLIATVSKDPSSHKWSMEAGDIVLANNGFLCIDEADKLPADDMKAMHRPMEQGEVVVSKAGIHATLKANTSIFAVANPKAGMFISEASVAEQIDFPPTLLSRFDLIFILKDNPDKDVDLERAKQILQTHQGQEENNLPSDFVKKYFLYVSKLKPKLTLQASEMIGKLYTDIRMMSENNGKKVGMPITPRHLEGLVRMSEAHAKLRLSETVDVIDVEIAEGLFKHSLSDFGINMDLGVVDLAGIATKVKTGKRDKYYSILEYLKTKAKNGNDFKKKDVFPELQRLTGMNYGAIDEIYSMLHKEGDIFEHTTGGFRLTRI